jgi:NAD-dependent deacetylase
MQFKNEINQIAAKIAENNSNIVFTGAGISTESGIPDYRSKGGLWDKFQPIYFDDFMTSKEARVEYWRRKTELYNDLINAQPNAAHLALFELYELGLVEAIITQNIDGLHHKSGIPEERIIELHGNTLRVRCMSCDKLISIEEAHDRIADGDLAPECECGGYFKPDTISFGQAMPEKEVNRSIKLSSSANVFLVIGSTLLVQPAALMPDYAKKAGAFLAIINLSQTPYDNACDALIIAKAGEILPRILKQIQFTRPIS